MTQKSIQHSTRIDSAKRRRGSTATELLVSATLLMTAIGIVGRVTVHSRRVWVDIRHSQLALDELSNHMDRLATLETNQLRAAVVNLVPSDPARQSLAGVKLTAKIFDDDFGERLELSIDWHRAQNAQPLTLVRWVNQKSS